MAKSHYEKYIVRKPGIVVRVGKDEYVDKVPDTDKIYPASSVNTGPRVIFSSDLIKGATTKVEYGYITGDTTIGNGQDFDPHKHDYEEIFLFLGTNPEDTNELGAEVEFWLGEGNDLEKVVFNSSSCVYVAPGVAHFPQIWKNVKRPVMTMVIMPKTGERVLKAVSLKGRVNPKTGEDSIQSHSVKATLAVEEGPYYKANSPERTRLFEEGIPGDKLTLTGHVLDTEGKPIAHAWLDFWQANGKGEYDNTGYILRGHQYSDKSARYTLETVLPGAYPQRTPHIHVKVRANDNSPILTTQLFIPGIASNKTDFLYQEALLMEMKDTPEGKLATFDFVINK